MKGTNEKFLEETGNRFLSTFQFDCSRLSVGIKKLISFYFSPNVFTVDDCVLTLLRANSRRIDYLHRQEVLLERFLI